MTLACFKRCFQVVFPNLVCFRVRFHTINLWHTRKEKKTKQKTRSLNQQKKIRKTHVSFPNFLAAQNTTPFNKQLTLTVSGRDLKRALARSGLLRRRAFPASFEKSSSSKGLAELKRKKKSLNRVTVVQNNDEIGSRCVDAMTRSEKLRWNNNKKKFWRND